MYDREEGEGFVCFAVVVYITKFSVWKNCVVRVGGKMERDVESSCITV